VNPACWLVRRAAMSPGAAALVCHDRVVADYRGFGARAAAIGGYLRQHHAIGAGDRVAIFMHNRTQYLEAMYGIWFTGAAVVPINCKLHGKEAAWIVENADATLALVSGGLQSELAAHAPACLKTLISADGADWQAMYHADPLAVPAAMDQDDLLWLFYTSGTTGKPKGVMITAGNITAMTLAYFCDVDEVHARDSILYAAPMSHGAGLYNFMHVIKGARHVVPASGGFDAGEILALAAQLGNVSMFAAPTMVKRLVDHARATGATGAGIKTVIYGGAPMYVADIRAAVQVLGDRFVQIYGQGECPMAVSVLARALVSDRVHPRWRERLASVGVAQSVSRVRIARADGTDLAPGGVGEILVRGAVVMAGYWRNAPASAKAIRDGWLWTGDIGTLDQDGFLTLHDRSKDMIISGGSNIYPREVEEVLLELDSVSEVAVVARADPEWGEEVVAFVVPTAGAALCGADLDAHCIKNIARFKRPRQYRLVAALPKNNYGKVLKTELREILRNEG